MAGEDRPTSNPVVVQLLANARGSSFFQLLRRLERQLRCTPIGHSDLPADDPIRFGQKASLAFATSAIEGFKPAAGKEAPKLFVNFMGLLGPNGPMPIHLTDFVRERVERAKDPTLASFLDLFNHRMVSFFYRAWACNQPTVSWERSGDWDAFTRYVSSLFGIGLDGFRNRDPIPDSVKCYYAGRLACSTKNADGLQAVLEEYLGVPVEIRQFVGEWVPLPPECCCRVGESPETGSLGQTLVAGSRTWQCQHRFRVRLGPMQFDQYRRFLPGGEGIKRLTDWVRNYVGDEFAWDVQPVLLAGDVPGTQLGSAGNVGWTVWTASGPIDHDADDLIVDPVIPEYTRAATATTGLAPVGR